MSNQKIIKQKSAQGTGNKKEQSESSVDHGKPQGRRMKSGPRPRTGRVEIGKQSFLILDAPTDENIQGYVEVLKKERVSIVVRACEPTYNPDPIKKAGIRFKELPFADGDPPTEQVLDEWLILLSEEFSKKKPSTVGVHCVAGLGRAPILVALALVESGIDATEAIDIVRKRRKGAFNAKQLRWIEKYKPRSKHCGPIETCVIL